MEIKNNASNSNKRAKPATAKEILGQLPKSRMGPPEIDSNGHRRVDGRTFVYQTSKSKNYVIDKKYGKLHSVAYISRVLSQELAMKVQVHDKWFLVTPSCILMRIREAIEEGLLDDLVLGGWAGVGKNSIAPNQQIQNMEQVKEYMLLKGFKEASKLKEVMPSRNYEDMVEHNKIRQSRKRKRRKLKWFNKLGKWLFEIGK